jgi:Uncharacterized protein conserved in bacteria (DUF2188)
MGIRDSMNDVHVVPNGHGWTIEAQGVHRDDVQTQVEAILIGYRLAEAQGGEVIVHGPPEPRSGPARDG